MVNVLILQGGIPHYRRPIFEELGRYVNLTIACTEGDFPSGVHYNTVRIQHKYRIPHIGYFHAADLTRMIRKADVLISPLTTGYLECDILRLIAPRVKHIRWGIGVPADYNVRYDSTNGYNHYLRMVKHCDAALFYSDYPKVKYAELGIDSGKLFVANNTVIVEAVNGSVDRSNLIFVGTLYVQKKVDLLLEAYFYAFNEEPSIPDLMIVGDGDQKENLIEMAKKLGINHKVRFMGRIEDEKELSQLFSSAIACISPDQAGLTVLKSMGYGVPFVTLKDAITGGEIFNVQNGVNGVLMDSIEELPHLIVDIGRNKDKYIEYGKKAYEHYHNHRRPEMMVEGFLQAINYVTKE